MGEIDPDAEYILAVCSRCRRLLSSYRGPLTRWRSPAGHEVDAYTGADGDALAAAGWVMVVMYDQSGNGGHLRAGGGEDPV